MKGLRSFGVFTAIALNCFCIQAGPPAEKAQPAEYRLTVELQDGSRVVGKSREKHFAFHSASLGDMTLPLEKVRAVEARGKAGQAKLSTADQDSLMVEFAMKDIRVETAFGDVKLPVSLIKSIRVTPSGKGSRPLDGLVGLWKGDGNADDSAGANNGVNTGVGYTEGVAGQAFSVVPTPGSFGERRGIQIADGPAFFLTNSLTIEAWIRPRGDGNVIFARADRQSGLYTLSMRGDNHMEFHVRDESRNTAMLVTEIPYCVWTHVAGTLDGNTGVMRIYTNGVVATEEHTDVRAAGELEPEMTPGIGIGNVNDGVHSFPFVGDIDEVALYNRALSEAEVKATYDEHAATAGGRAEMISQRRVPNPRIPVRRGFDVN